MAKVGYLRVSSEGQNTDRQLAELVLDKTFVEKVSGKNTDRAALQSLLEFIREGDEVFVHSLDRLARNLQDLLALIEKITSKGASIHFQKESLNFKAGTSDPMANLLLGVLGSFAQFERSIILERQREGIAIAKAKGAYKGRKPALTPEQVLILKERVNKGEVKASIARDMKITPATLYNYLKA